MKPYVCRRHGHQAPDVVKRTGRKPLRLCPICRSARQARRQKDAVAESQANWYAQNRDRIRRRDAKKRAQNKAAVIAGYGGECECCGETAPEFLTIDHIFGGGRHERTTTMKGLKLYRWLIANGFPRDRYRLLCMNCNFSHGRYGYCPHQRKHLKAV